MRVELLSCAGCWQQVTWAGLCELAGCGARGVRGSWSQAAVSEGASTCWQSGSLGLGQMLQAARDSRGVHWFQGEPGLPGELHQQTRGAPRLCAPGVPVCCTDRPAASDASLPVHTCGRAHAHVRLCTCAGAAASPDPARRGLGGARARRAVHAPVRGGAAPAPRPPCAASPCRFLPAAAAAPAQEPLCLRGAGGSAGGGRGGGGGEDAPRAAGLSRPPLAGGPARGSSRRQACARAGQAGGGARRARPPASRTRLAPATPPGGGRAPLRQEARWRPGGRRCEECGAAAGPAPGGGGASPLGPLCVAGWRQRGRVEPPAAR